MSPLPGRTDPDAGRPAPTPDPLACLPGHVGLTESHAGRPPLEIFRAGVFKLSHDRDGSLLVEMGDGAGVIVERIPAREARRLVWNLFAWVRP